MHKKLFMALLCLLLSLNASAQKVYKEVLRMSKETLNDPQKDIETRKIARFKVDALEYMAMKTLEQMPDSNVSIIDFQSYALYEFVSLYVKRLSEAKNKKQKQQVERIFTEATIANARFHDMDTSVTLAYYNSTEFITRFSLDCDWQKALAEVRSKDWAWLG